MHEHQIVMKHSVLVPYNHSFIHSFTHSFIFLIFVDVHNFSSNILRVVTLNIVRIASLSMVFVFISFLAQMIIRQRSRDLSVMRPDDAGCGSCETMTSMMMCARLYSRHCIRLLQLLLSMMMCLVAHCC